MRTKSDREGFVQVLMNSDATAGQRRAQLTELELPDTISETHRVVARYHPLLLHGENQIEILAPQRYKRRPSIAGRNAEALIELRDVLGAQKSIGSLNGSDAAPSQLLRQTPLPGTKAAFAASAR